MAGVTLGGVIDGLDERLTKLEAELAELRAKVEQQQALIRIVSEVLPTVSQISALINVHDSAIVKIFGILSRIGGDGE